MNWNFWNIRGLENLAKRKIVAEVVHNNKMDIMYLEEIKLMTLTHDSSKE